MIKLSHFTYIVIIGLLFIFLACEKEKSSLVDSSFLPPFMQSADLSISFINIDTTSGTSVVRLPDGKFKITISISAQTNDPIGISDIKQVSYRVYRPGSQGYYPSGLLTRESGIPDSTVQLYSGTITFTISRTDIGIYTIEVFAQSKANLSSNSLQLPLLIAKNNSVPQIFNLSAPDTLIRPTSGSRPVYFALSASDSDGYKDIVEVYFRSINSGSPNFHQPMFDDGSLAFTRDSVAGDGRYSRVVPLDQTATLGTKEFRFYAKDKSGALSDSIIQFITIIAE
jgi:hypothetical protein